MATEDRPDPLNVWPPKALSEWIAGETMNPRDIAIELDYWLWRITGRQRHYSSPLSGGWMEDEDVTDRLSTGAIVKCAHCMKPLSECLGTNDCWLVR